MKSWNLDGPWELASFPEGELAVDGPGDLDQCPLTWIPATVPGNVELDLLAAGEIADPFFASNIYGLRDLESREWWYRTTFESPEIPKQQDLILRLDGVDCIATVWLNGKMLGRTRNMLIAHTLPIPEGLIRTAENHLVVRIGSAVNAAASHRFEPSHAALQTNFEQLPIRKAPHMYGWDIAPRIVSAGLWRRVTVEAHSGLELVDISYTTVDLSETGATLRVLWQFRTDTMSWRDLRIRVRGECGTSSFHDEFQPVFVAGERRILVEDPLLWWPTGYGDPNLYSVTVELMRENEVVDHRRDQIGLRTVELIRTQTAGDEGEFLFRLNDVPVFCKGSNWVPLDAFHSRDAERYEKVLDLFVDTGCNIVRCWGGNVYEDHTFFGICDRQGIMVWQDFSFACGIYPQSPSFMEEVRAEATAVVRNLRNHPSIILWAGDNEIDMAYVDRGLDPARNRISREILPQVCAELDPYRPYLESSPYVSPAVVERKPRDQRLMPEQHLWGPRDYFKGPFYAGNTAHFASEIGYHGCPGVSSVRRFIDKDHLWPWRDNPQWIAHATDAVESGGRYAYRIPLMARQIKELFGWTPDNLEDFALASQISQAEAKKYFIESFRIHKWRRTGIIWWNMIDCWPQFSDAIVDYYFVKKLAYWYIKRVQTPFAIMIDEPASWGCRVVGGNDSRERRRGEFIVTDGEAGQELLSGAFDVDPNTSSEIGRIDASHGEHRLFLITWETDGGQGGNHYLLGKPPIDFGWYRGLLQKIGDLPFPFDAAAIAG